MTNSQSQVQFQPESSSIDFQPDSSLGQSRGGSAFSWNKAAIGVGAVAAVAGAAYAANRYIGRGSSDNRRSERLERESAYT